MKRLRRELLAFSPAVAVLFALTLAAPRSAFIYHHHAGGERAHVHADEDGLIAALTDAHEHGHPHSHPHAAAPAASRGTAAHRHLGGRAVLTGDDGGGGGHYHQQPRFQRALAAAPPCLLISTLLAPVPTAAPRSPSHEAAVALHARAPPAILS